MKSFLNNLVVLVLICGVAMFIYNRKLDLVESLIADHYFKHPVKITGADVFEARIKKCLNLLAFKAKGDYQFVIENVAEVEHTLNSHINVSSHPAIIGLALEDTFHSYPWCAAALVYAASHSSIENGRKKRGNEKFRSSRLIFADQKKIYARQLQTLINLGADKSDIDFMTALDPKDIDINKDGRFTHEDSRLSN